MQSSNQSSNFPNKFQQQALALIHELIDVTSSVFYLLGPDMRHRDVALSNLDEHIEQEYHKKFRVLDPLDPRKFNSTEDRVVTIDSQMPFNKLRQTIYYQDFMQPHDHRYVADMFFRYQGEVVAVLSMLRHESIGQYSESDLSLLRKLQPFLEYTLNTVYLPKRIGERQSLESKYGLTPRELDVLELIMAGGSNKVIATQLALGLPTVKTHVQNIFHKTDSSSRTELLARVFSELTG